MLWQPSPRIVCFRPLRPEYITERGVGKYILIIEKNIAELTRRHVMIVNLTYNIIHGLLNNELS